MRFAVILPARNEEEAIGPTLAELRPCHPAQIIVADNGSSDSTAARAAAEGATVVSEPRPGYGRACLAAMAALATDIEIVVFMDADGSDDPAALPSLLEPILGARADMVVGSRLPAAGTGQRLPAHQRWGNGLAAWLVERFYGIRFTDLGPFRAIRREALDRLAMADPNYGWTIEMQIKAALAGLRVREAPVPHRPRRAGRSKVSGTVRGSALAGAKILWTIFRYRFAPPRSLR
ncbi:MAG TPA: glycosyltransferase family 2 protein [Candidatus Acidoferrales bacterium]|nr:glycosyltransferase family 2 protein [Candidatus Acidoferrales bacterium]